VDLLTSARGDALLIVDGEPARVATGWADDRAILQLEQGRATVAPWQLATAQNRLQPPQPHPMHPGSSAHGGQREQGEGEPVAPVVAGLFPIERRAPTEAEAAKIRELFHQGQSLNALCRQVYGHKDSRAFAWIKQAIEHGSAEPESEVQADMIDLSTEAGRRQFEAMQSAGLIRLPDVSHLFTTEGN
jgi:transposase-like protein